MKKIYYEKRGRRYVPVSEYNDDWMDSFPEGTHLIICYPGGVSRRYRIDPNYAAMISAGRVAEDVISDAIYKATEIHPPRKAMSQEEADAWNNLIAVWGDEARSLTRPCARDIAEAGVKAMIAEADKLMQHEAVRKSYEHFLLMCKMTKKHEYQNS